MEKLKQKTLALFFTNGVSLKIWDKVGNLNREIKPYNELSRYFNKIYFFTYGDKKDLEYQKNLSENIIIRPNKWKTPSLLYSFLLPFFYKKELRECNILKTNQMSGSWSAMLVKLIYGKKLVVRCGYEWLSFTEKQKKALWKRIIIYLVEKIVYSIADKIIITSNRDKNFIVQKLSINSEKIQVIPNYIDTNLFKSMEVKKEKSRVIFIGRLGNQKNLFNLISAVNNLNVNLVLVGSGPLILKLESFAKEKGIKVDFKGNISNQELPKELNKSEIFILPSLYEGCPKTLLEAMSCGIPCIGTNVDGIKEIIKHKENGYLCETNSSSIKKAILEILGDKKLQQQISQGARQTIVNNFSLENIIFKEKSIYEVL